MLPLQARSRSDAASTDLLCLGSASTEKFKLICHFCPEVMAQGMHTPVQLVDNNKVSHAFNTGLAQALRVNRQHDKTQVTRFCHSAGDEEEYQQHQHRRPGEEELHRPSGAQQYRVHKEDQEEPGETSGARQYR